MSDCDLRLLELWEQLFDFHTNYVQAPPTDTTHKPVGKFLAAFNPNFEAFSAIRADNVYMSFEENELNFQSEPDGKIISWIDLDNEELVWEKTPEETKQVCDEEVSDSLHPVYIHSRPLSIGHSLLPLFKDECIPQVVSAELLSLVLNVYRLFTKPSLKLGFDSIGANCLYNHLYFEMIFLDILNGQEKLPVEYEAMEDIMTSTLKHKKSGEIDMFSVGVKLQRLNNYPARCIVVRPEGAIEEQQVSDATDSIGSVAGMILNYMVENNIPHSLLVADNGLAVYIFPRNFSSTTSNEAGFLEMSGLFRPTSASGYETVTEDTCRQWLEELTCDESTYRNISEYIQSLLTGLYY
jgi:hypothetical protein